MHRIKNKRLDRHKKKIQNLILIDHPLIFLQIQTYKEIQIIQLSYQLSIIDRKSIDQFHSDNLSNMLLTSMPLLFMYYQLAICKYTYIHLYVFIYIYSLLQNNSNIKPYMSNIFNEQNQMIIRFPQSLAQQLNQYFQQGGEQPQITIECDPTRSQQVPRISLQVGYNDQQFKATVVQLPTISSTFKTIDRVNFFKSNDISEMIVVHQSTYDDVPEWDAEKVVINSNGTEKVKKYLGESGITDATTNIRQRFFRKKPMIDHQLVAQVDLHLDSIKTQFTKQDDKTDRNKKKKSNMGE